MSDWIMPLIMGAAFYVMGTLRSRVISLGRPPDRLGRVLRGYGTVWAVGEGYLILCLRWMLDGTALYGNLGVIVTIASLLWLAVVVVFGVLRNRQRRLPDPH
jgi:hypothetical protein